MRLEETTEEVRIRRENQSKDEPWDTPTLSRREIRRNQQRINKGKMLTKRGWGRCGPAEKACQRGGNHHQCPFLLRDQEWRAENSPSDSMEVTDPIRTVSLVGREPEGNESL